MSWQEKIDFDSASFRINRKEKRRGEQRHVNWVTNGGVEVQDDGKLVLRGHDKVHGGGNTGPRRETWPGKD